MYTEIEQLGLVLQSAEPEVKLPPRLTRRRDIKAGIIVEFDGGVFCVADATPAPCDTCPSKARCRDNELACASFAGYTDCVAGWEELDKEPSADIYAMLYEVGDDERAYLKAAGTKLRARAARGELSKLAAVAGELAVKDDLILFAHEASPERLHVVLYGCPSNPRSSSGTLLRSVLGRDEEIDRIYYEGQRAREVIDQDYNDARIASRVGVSEEFVRSVRNTHAEYNATSARGGVRAVEMDIIKGKWAKKQARRDQYRRERGEV